MFLDPYVWANSIDLVPDQTVTHQNFHFMTCHLHSTLWQNPFILILFRLAVLLPRLISTFALNCLDSRISSFLNQHFQASIKLLKLGRLVGVKTGQKLQRQFSCNRAH